MTNIRAIPILLVSDMDRAIEFYTRTLIFRVRSETSSPTSPVVELYSGDAELLLTRIEGDQVPGINVCFRVDSIDTLFRGLVERGLSAPDDGISPVHENPVEQTWGQREFYVTDPDGNTLRFSQRLS